MLIASYKFVHSSASFEAVLTTLVILFTCGPLGYLSSAFTSKFGNFITSTVSPGSFTVEKIVATGIVSSTSLNWKPTSVFKLGISPFSTITVSGFFVSAGVVSLLAGPEQPPTPPRPTRPARPIKNALKPVFFALLAFSPVNETSSHLPAFAR